MFDIGVAVKVAFCAVGGFLGSLLGGWDGFVYALLVFVVMDYATGVSRALIEKKLSSAVGFTGIVRKTLIFAMVAVGNVIDQYIIGGGVIRNVVIFFYISNEGISLLENASALGLPVPEKLRDVLAQLRNK